MSLALIAAVVCDVVLPDPVVVLIVDVALDFDPGERLPTGATR